MGGGRRQQPQQPEHDEELLDLQRRFKSLEEEQRLHSERNNGTTPRGAATSARVHRERTAVVDIGDSQGVELAKLDEQISNLRRKHDDLAHSNMEKRRSLEKLTDRLHDLAKEAKLPTTDDNPTVREIKVLESRLKSAVSKYEDAYEVRRTYEQVVKRLKEERISFSNQLEAREIALKAKETDYEELLLMSHDANQSKEQAKLELSKFEGLVSEERKLRERELAERRTLVAKKQEVNHELEKREKARRDAMSHPEKEDVPSQAKHTISEADIEEEQEKISSYEAAFKEIKEATGVADVNEVIQKFITQEETHKSLQSMTRESQVRIDELSLKKISLAERVSRLKYSTREGDKDQPGVDAHHSPSTRSSDRQRVKYDRLTKILVDVKAGVTHLAERLEGVKLEGQEHVEPLVPTEDNMADVLSDCVQRLRIVLDAIRQEEEALIRDMGEEALKKMPGFPVEPPVLNNYRIKDPREGEGEAPSDEEFEEEFEEDVVEREHLKKQSDGIVDKATKKTKKRQKKKNA